MFDIYNPKQQYTVHYTVIYSLPQLSPQQVQTDCYRVDLAYFEIQGM